MKLACAAVALLSATVALAAPRHCPVAYDGEKNGWIIAASAEPDGASRARLQALVDRLWSSDLPPMAFTASERARLATLMILTLHARDCPWDGNGLAGFEWMFFDPLLQPEGLSELELDRADAAEHRDRGLDETMLAKLAAEGTPGSRKVFLKVLDWPCELRDPPPSDVVVRTWTDKAIAVAGLTRVGTPAEVEKGLRSLRACAEDAQPDWLGKDMPPDVAEQKAEADIRAAPQDPVKWREWFENGPGTWLDSD